jgi:Uma2 family endonuclease
MVEELEMAIATQEAPSALLTYEDYLEAFGKEAPSRQRYEILDGVPIMPPSPRYFHQVVADNITELFRQYRRQGGKGRTVSSPMDVLIRPMPLRVRQPDVLFMSEERYRQNGGRQMDGPILFAPELVVEVVSPSETRSSLLEKMADYQSIGVKECWIVSPQAETVEVLELTPDMQRTIALYGQGQQAQSHAFSDLTVTVADIFAD